jgi:hypothetical protein
MVWTLNPDGKISFRYASAQTIFMDFWTALSLSFLIRSRSAATIFLPFTPGKSLGIPIIIKPKKEKIRERIKEYLCQNLI